MKTCRYCKIEVTKENSYSFVQKEKLYIPTECKSCRIKNSARYKTTINFQNCSVCEIQYIKSRGPNYCSLFCSFISKVEKTEHCWIWKGVIGQDGYGKLNSLGMSDLRAHRIAYKLFNSNNIKNGSLILHSCNNKLCVNPDHLRQGTNNENMKDLANSGILKGENHPIHKLTNTEVIKIKKLYDSGYTQTALGKMFQVSQVLVGLIVNGKAWSHINI